MTCPIPPGGHFPPIELEDAPTDADWAREAPVVDKNHGSFQQPAREQLQQLVEKGFARIYSSRAAAEEALGGKCYPAPLGDVVKPLPGGGEKHRIIQDSRFNHVNDRVRLPERPINPRFVDYAADLAWGSFHGDAQSVILDYEHAFMAVPSSPEEARYNCCLVDDGDPVHRERPPLDPDEPTSGTFLVWLVLGFGGKAFPLLYARVPLVLSLPRASFGERVNGRFCVPSVPPFTHAHLPPCVKLNAVLCFCVWGGAVGGLVRWPHPTSFLGCLYDFQVDAGFGGREQLVAERGVGAGAIADLRR